MRSANSRNPARRPPVGWDPRGPDQLGLLERPLGPEGLQGVGAAVGVRAAGTVIRIVAEGEAGETSGLAADGVGPFIPRERTAPVGVVWRVGSGGGAAVGSRD